MNTHQARLLLLSATKEPPRKIRSKEIAGDEHPFHMFPGFGIAGNNADAVQEQKDAHDCEQEHSHEGEHLPELAESKHVLEADVGAEEPNKSGQRPEPIKRFHQSSP